MLWALPVWALANEVEEFACFLCEFEPDNENNAVEIRCICQKPPDGYALDSIALKPSIHFAEVVKSCNFKSHEPVTEISEELELQPQGRTLTSRDDGPDDEMKLSCEHGRR